MLTSVRRPDRVVLFGGLEDAGLEYDRAALS